MFQIDEFLSHPELSSLRKRYEKDENDRRLVVVVNNGEPLVDETVALHKDLASSGYIFIPSTWETEDLDEYDVVHIRNLSLQTQRLNPFTNQPVALNSWLNRLPSERFDAILLAQELGELGHILNKRELLEIKEELESDLDTYWQGVVGNVRRLQLGMTPQSQEQVKLLNAWNRAINRRFFVPMMTEEPSQKENREKQLVKYNWNHMLRAELSSFIKKNMTKDSFIILVHGISNAIQYRVNFETSYQNIVYNVVQELDKSNLLDILAAEINFVPQKQQVLSAFNQGGQTVYGEQVNINTGGDSYKVVIGSGARNVAIGSNIRQG